MLLRIVPLTTLFVATSVSLAGQTIAPVTPDPFEIATGIAHTASTPEERAAALGLLRGARVHYDLHSSNTPYGIKVTFHTTGSSHYEGSGDMEEIYQSSQDYRWNVNLGGYTGLRIYSAGVPYDQRPPGPLPLRVSQIRHAIFSPIYLNFPQFKIRTVEAVYNGTKVTCVLLATGGVPTEAPGRHWPEVEYCVDPHTGLLQVYSEVPGSFVMYDYSSPVAFHGHTLARGITVAEAGVKVAEARIESIRDAAGVDPSLFIPTAEMKARGLGTVLQEPIRTFLDVGRKPLPPDAEFHPVEVRAVLAEDGSVSDAQALQTDDAAKSQAAVDLVSHHHFAFPTAVGGAPVQHEIFVNVRFVSVPQR